MGRSYSAANSARRVPAVQPRISSFTVCCYGYYLQHALSERLLRPPRRCRQQVYPEKNLLRDPKPQPLNPGPLHPKPDCADVLFLFPALAASISERRAELVLSSSSRARTCRTHTVETAHRGAPSPGFFGVF